VAVSETGAISCNTHEKCYVFNGKMMIDHQICEYCALFSRQANILSTKIGGIERAERASLPYWNLSVLGVIHI